MRFPRTQNGEYHCLVDYFVMQSTSTPMRDELHNYLKTLQHDGLRVVGGGTVKEEANSQGREGQATFQVRTEKCGGR
jgi:hypothetical protein